MHNLIEIFKEHPSLAIVISLLLSIVVAIAGIIPSVFITAANIVFFGFWPGFAISLLGEALGAIVSFYLYRKSFKPRLQRKIILYPKVNVLINASPQRAFTGVMLLRILPFVPSGIVTFAAAISNMNALSFIISSTVGKIPSLLLEVYSVKEVIAFNWQGKLILALLIIGGLYFLFRKSVASKKGDEAER